ncbi:hypothetical protein E2C01_097874 [Portunus trituberculatus]|uniref:Uncharacterized protein n=1 Tax=Portunus trituberculatus TaxID=210409 RepID=A0A5B7KAP0_PORTR|nr:hypothetical protein [Portunus trituberculatus]
MDILPVIRNVFASHYNHLSRLQRKLAGFPRQFFPFNELEILPIYHQNHENTLNNTSILKWISWKAVMVREQSVS